MSKPIEIWEREDGWTIEVYSREPRKVSRVPLIVAEDDGSYEFFVGAARANGYGKVFPISVNSSKM